MVTVSDVAAYILKKHGQMTAMKLQKLVYYAHAWSLVWDEKPLFREKIRAWANGPVCPALYAQHKGRFNVASLPSGNPDALSKPQRETVDAILKFYGDKSSQWLSDLTHFEPPWRDTRKGIPDGQHGDHEITHEAMAEYYGSLPK